MVDQTLTSSSLGVNGSNLGSALADFLHSDDIEPGSDPSYQQCKALLAYHPLGARMASGPIKLAQSQSRLISVPDGPESRLVDAYKDEWKRLKCDYYIANHAKLARAYGVAALAVVIHEDDDRGSAKPLELKNLYQKNISFNVYDPLNVSGSLVLNQQPNANDFQQPGEIRVMGRVYHRSRSVVLMNEEPIYLDYTRSAFGYVGRSVYQRALFPLKSYLQTMIADDMVAKKAGVIVMKTRQSGSIMNNVMSAAIGVKRAKVQAAQTGNVLSIAAGDPEEDVFGINLENVNTSLTTARGNILENIATAADMPAILIKQDSFAAGFSEGTEDAKKVAEYIDGIRSWMDPDYVFMDDIVMYRAWNPEFYKTIQKEFKEYKNVPYEDAFYKWRNTLTKEWPSLIEEPESDKVKVDEVRLKSTILAVELLMPEMDPYNRAQVIKWLATCFNERKIMFPAPLTLDYKKMEQFFEDQNELGIESDNGDRTKKKRDHVTSNMDNMKSNIERLPDVSADRMKRKKLGGRD